MEITIKIVIITIMEAERACTPAFSVHRTCYTHVLSAIKEYCYHLSSVARQ